MHVRLALNTSFSGGKDDQLDLMKMVLPYRKAKVVKQYLKALKFSFALTNEEAWWIARVHEARSLSDVQRIVEQSFSKNDVSWGLEYIRTAIHHA